MTKSSLKLRFRYIYELNIYKMCIGFTQTVNIMEHDTDSPFKFNAYDSLLACIALLCPSIAKPDFDSSNIAIVSVSLPEEHVNTAVFVSYKSPGFKP